MTALGLWEPADQPAVIRALHAPSWIVVAEGNEFVWPGYDLRKVAGTDRYEHGFLPPRFFNQVLQAFVALRDTGKGQLTSRE